jgi:hypothetical protein
MDEEPRPPKPVDEPPRFSDDPDRQRRRLRLLAELAEARSAREARKRSGAVPASHMRIARSERIRELIAIRRRLAG